MRKLLTVYHSVTWINETIVTLGFTNPYSKRVYNPLWLNFGPPGTRLVTPALWLLKGIPQTMHRLSELQNKAIQINTLTNNIQILSLNKTQPVWAHTYTCIHQPHHCKPELRGAVAE